MPWIAAVAGLAGSYLASESQSDAASGAAQTSSDATRYGIDVNKQIYDQTRTDQAPWRQAGVSALSQLTAGTKGLSAPLLRPFDMRDYNRDPGYQFRMNEGMKGLERSAAARGGLLSGSMLKGVTRYGQDFASNEYQNAYNRYNTNQGNQYNRLSSMAGLGQTANTALGQAGQNYATGVSSLAQTGAADQGNAQLFAGQSRASMYGGMSNALSRYFQPQQQQYGGGGYGQPVQYIEQPLNGGYTY